MSVINRQEMRSFSPFIETRDLAKVAEKTGNIYQGLSIIATRANQISQNIKEELHSKLEEFAPTTDNLEEIFENSEQIEISKFYERMPSPTLMATQEYLEDKIFFRPKEDSASGEI